MRSIVRFVGPIYAALLTLAVDQGSKLWAIHELTDAPMVLSPYVTLGLSFNLGFSFGIPPGNLVRYPETVAAIKILLAGTVTFCAASAKSPTGRLGLSLAAGGAFGNALDRFRHGWVTDFISLHVGPFELPAFNLADLAIVVGCALFTASSLLRGPERYD